MHEVHGPLDDGSSLAFLLWLGGKVINCPLPPPPSRSYLKAVENLSESELDRSKPFVPVLETSSQLEDSSGEGSEPQVVINATPLPVRKKGVKRSKKAATAKDENKEPVSVEATIYLNI